MELVDLKHLTQDQLVNIINRATHLLEQDNYVKTYLFITGLEGGHQWDCSK